MKLRIKGEITEIEAPCICGIVSLKADAVLDLEELIARAARLKEEGAQFLEVGVENCQDEDVELKLLPDAVAAVSRTTSCFVAVHARHPEVMRRCCENGAVMIVSSDALRTEGALEMAASLKVPICLMCNIKFEEDNTDPTAAVSEFLYERLDACLNAGIARSHIILDPAPGVKNSLKIRLKAIGRLHTFKSFALPLSIAVPRVLPFTDEPVIDHPGVYAALALFAVDSGVSLIRTAKVGEVALAIDTHLVCSKSAEPFRLSKAIFKAIKKKRESLKIL